MDIDLQIKIIKLLTNQYSLEQKEIHLHLKKLKKLAKVTQLLKLTRIYFMRNFQKMQIAIKDRKISLSISTNKKLINNNYISPRIITDYNPINLNNDSIVNKTLKIIKLLFKRLLN